MSDKLYFQMVVSGPISDRFLKLKEGDPRVFANFLESVKVACKKIGIEVDAFQFEVLEKDDGESKKQDLLDNDRMN